MKALILFAAFALLPNLCFSENQTLSSAQKNSLEWLEMVDKGEYAKSWDFGSLTLQLRIPKTTWVTLLNTMRRPLGSVVNRKFVEERIAENPAGLPKGEYRVVVFSTDFSKEKGEKELLTLVLESDGLFRILTYHVAK